MGFVAQYNPGAERSGNQSCSVTVANGDRLVIIGTTNDSNNTLSTPTGGSLIYSLVKSATGVTNTSNIYAWTTTASSNQTFTLAVNSNQTTGANWSFDVLRFSSVDVIGASTSTSNGGSAPSLNITTTQANSILVVGVGDFNVVSGASRTWRTGAGTLSETDYQTSAAGGSVTFYAGYHANAGAIGVKTVGLTAPTGQAPAMVAVEVLLPTAVLGTVNLTGSGTLTATGTPAEKGTVTLSGAGTLTATASPTFTGAMSLSGAGTLTATGNICGVVYFTGSGVVAFTGKPLLVRGTTGLTGVGVLSPLGQGMSAGGHTSLVGDGSLAAGGSLDFDLFFDGFNFADVSKWSFGTGSSVTNGELILACTSTYSQVTTNNWHALLNAAVIVELITRPPIGNGGTETYLRIANTPTATDQWLDVDLKGTILAFRYRKSGAVTTLATVTFNATTHRFWRIREAAGTVFWETGPDSNTMTVRASALSSTFWDLGFSQLMLGAGYTGTEAGPGPAVFDHLNTPIVVPRQWNGSSWVQIQVLKYTNTGWVQTTITAF